MFSRLELVIVDSQVVRVVRNKQTSKDKKKIQNTKPNNNNKKLKVIGFRDLIPHQNEYYPEVFPQFYPS